MRIGIATLLVLLAVGTAWAELPLEQAGRVEVLSQPPSPHWVWAWDALLRRGSLVDLDDGRFLGIVNGGWGSNDALVGRARSELYVPETHYSRGSRGDRTDVVTIYDTATLAPVGEVEIPPRKALYTHPHGNFALSDDERFLAVFNLTPATSLSIVDLERRTFAGEIATPGCSLAFAAGPRRFLMICADGALLSVRIDAAGQAIGRVRTEAFFDPAADPIFDKAARHGDVWLFPTFAGDLRGVDVSGPELRIVEAWSLSSDSERADAWRPGGTQPFAVHERTGQLYVLMHQGGPNTHKDEGSEIWVFDLARRERVRRIALVNPGLSYLGQSLEFGQDWIWPFGGLYSGILCSCRPWSRRSRSPRMPSRSS